MFLVKLKYYAFTVASRTSADESNTGWQSFDLFHRWGGGGGGIEILLVSSSCYETLSDEVSPLEKERILWTSGWEGGGGGREWQECFSLCTMTKLSMVSNILPVSSVVPSICSPVGNDRNKHLVKISSDLSRHLRKSVTQHNKELDVI